MNSRIPRWLWLTIAVVVVVAIGTGVAFAFHASATTGWIVTGVLVALLGVIAAVAVPPLVKLYRFQKYFKQHEAQLNMLPSLMQTGRTQEALMRFEGVMKHAPDNAYLFYLRAFFLQAAGKLPEAMAAANKALALAGRDPYLPMMLQQMGGQVAGQPSTVEGFKEQLQELRQSLEPRVNQMRVRREKAVARRKKKSR